MSFKLRTATAAVLLAISAGGAIAQPPDAARPGASPAASSHSAAIAPTPSASAAASSGASSNGSVYRSAFDRYRAFADQPVLSWRESNDLVGRIGGWQAYAREGQGAPAAAPSPGTPTTVAPGMPGTPSTPSTPSMPSMPAGHGGHGGMAMPPPASAASAAPGHHSGPRKP